MAVTRSISITDGIAFGGDNPPLFIAGPCVIESREHALMMARTLRKLRDELKKTKKVDEAVLKVVREEFKESSPIRFEGNGYSQEWVHDAEKRGLLNLKRTPESLAQLVTKQTRALFSKLGILSKQELESRYHVRLERYAKDILIEAHTLAQVVDTMVLPASLAYASDLSDGVRRAKEAGLKTGPQTTAANKVIDLLDSLQKARATLDGHLHKAESLHDDPEKQAKLLTKEIADAMLATRQAADALEVVVADERWPLPKYREMLFPV